MKMFAIIPHPTEQKILADEQKKILSSLNEKQVAYDMEFPLWLFFDFDCSDLAEDKKENASQKYIDNINIIEEKFELETIFKDAIVSALAGNAKNGTAELKKLLQEINIFRCHKESGKVFFPIQIVFRNGNVLPVKIPLASERHNIHAVTESGTVAALPQEKLCRCKVFRVAQAERESADSDRTKIWSVPKSVWVKL